ncbi:hypothetical protein GVAV_000343 [Gurleya vavrai]
MIVFIHVLQILTKDSESSELSIFKQVPKKQNLKSKVGPPLENRLDYELSLTDYITNLLSNFHINQCPSEKLKIRDELVNAFNMAQQFVKNENTRVYNIALQSQKYSIAFDILQLDCDLVPFPLWQTYFDIIRKGDYHFQIVLKRKYQQGSFIISIDEENKVMYRYNWNVSGNLNKKLHCSIVLPHYVFEPSMLVKAFVLQDVLVFNYLLSFVFSQHEVKYQNIDKILKLFFDNASSTILNSILHAKLAIYMLLNSILVDGNLQRSLNVVENVLIEGLRDNEWTGNGRYYNAILYAFGDISLMK